MDFEFVISNIERENVIAKSRLPMNDSTPAHKATSTILNMTSKIARPSKDTLFFLQLFARMYAPQTVLGLA